MKSVGKGKKIFISASKLSTETPSSDFDFTSDQNAKRYKRQSRGCSTKVGFIDAKATLD